MNSFRCKSNFGPLMSGDMSSLSSVSGSSYKSCGPGSSSSNQLVMTDTKSYLCPKCNLNYDIILFNNVYVGKVPLIMNCSHTMCEECIRTSFNKRQVICAECQHVSVLEDKDNRKIQEIFPVNFYLMGIIYYLKPNKSEMSQLNLKPAGVSYKNRTRSTRSNNLPEISLKMSSPNENILQEKCSQPNCCKMASLRCFECDEVYCSKCSETLHKAARGLQVHKISPLTADYVPELTHKCPVHPDSHLEFLCNTCTKVLCCYCILQSHNGHNYSPLTYVNDSDRVNFEALIRSGEEKLKKLIMAYKKIKFELNQKHSNTEGGTTAVETAVGRYFTNIHAKLQFIENKLRRETLRVNSSSSQKLQELSGELVTNIRTLNGLIGTAKNVNSPNSNIKINVQVLTERLENALKLPCYFVSEQQRVEGARFVVGDVLDNLEDYFAIDKDDNSDSYRLVDEETLPEGYDTTLPSELSLLDVSEFHLPSVSMAIAASSTSSTSSVYSKSEKELSPSEILSKALQPKTPESPINLRAIEGWLETTEETTTKKRPVLKTDDREDVVVTHIDTPECFYVQLRRFNDELHNLSKRIEQYIRQFAPMAKNPELTKLYIVKYETKGGRPQWHRGRVIDIITDKKGEMLYNIQFIDFGNTQTVGIQKLREISADLAKPPPYALQCKLFNLYPRQHDWDRKAMILMAQIITGTDVIMVVINNAHGILEVDLLVVIGPEMASIRDALIFIGPGVPCADVSAPVVSLKMKSKKQAPKLHERSEGFKKGKEYNVIISHIGSPHNMYVQIADYVHHVEHLAEVMDRYYTSKPNKGQSFGNAKGDKANSIYVPRKGMAVAVRHKEVTGCLWYRGTVTDTIEGEGMVKALLVDYGKKVTVSYTQIRRLPERFHNLECQAILVKMADIRPCEGQAAWGQNVVDYLNKYVINKTKLVLQAVKLLSPVEVALYERYASMDVCINTLLVTEKLAVSTGNTSKQLEIIKKEPPAVNKEDNYVFDLINTIQGSKETNDESDSDSEDEKTLQNVARAQVKVLTVKSPDLIYVSILKEQMLNMQHELHSGLQNFYRQHQLEHKEWDVNDFCVVLDNRKKNYYRAVILEKIDGLNYRVILRDLAEEMVVSRNNIGILQSQFMQFGEGAVRCHLAGVTPAGDVSKWSGLAIEYLENIFDDNETIFMTKYGLPDKVRKSLPIIMWYAEFKPGEALAPSKTVLHNINKLLIKNGLALKERGVDLSLNTSKDSVQSVSTDTSSTETSSTTVTLKDVTQIEKHETQEQTKQVEETTTDPESSNKPQSPKIQFEVAHTSTPANDKETGTIKSEETVENQNVQEDELPSYNALFNRTSGSGSSRRSRSTEHFRRPFVGKPKLTSVSHDSSPVHFGSQAADAALAENEIHTEDADQINDWNELIEQDESCEVPDSICAENTSNMTDWLPSEPFKRARFEACVTFVDDYAHIYLHEAELEPALKCMEEKMKEHFDSTDPEPQGTIWVPGQLCTVKYFVNDSWYRGKVTGVTDEAIKVLMIDYGNEEDCKHDDLRFKVMYMDIPAFANKVQLYNVFPKPGGRWLTSDLDELHKKLVENKVRVTLKGSVKTSIIPAIVELNGVNINKLLLETSTNLVSHRRNILEELDANNDDVIIEDEHSDEATDAESTRDVMPQQQFNDNRYIQNPLRDSLIGQRINVTVTSLIDYNNFVFEILNDRNVEETKKLFDDISQDIRKSGYKQPVVYDIKAGQACVTKFSEDGEWYRGQISNVDNISHGVVEIWFVDFGNTENVPRDTVKAVRPEWLKLPILQYKGEIDGIELSDPSSLDVVINYMAQFCNTVQSAEIVSVAPLRVRLYNDKDELVYKDLIDQKLVVYKST